MAVAPDNEEDKERDKNEEEEVAADNDDGQEIKFIYSTNHILMIQNCMYYLIDIFVLSIFVICMPLFIRGREKGNVDKTIY